MKEDGLKKYAVYDKGVAGYPNHYQVRAWIGNEIDKHPTMIHTDLDYIKKRLGESSLIYHGPGKEPGIIEVWLGTKEEFLGLIT